MIDFFLVTLPIVGLTGSSNGMAWESFIALVPGGKLFGQPGGHAAPALAEVEEEPFDAFPESLARRRRLAHRRNTWDRCCKTVFAVTERLVRK